jgi:hypothetical protein
MSAFRLGSVLRAWLAQENSARGAVLRARQEADQAAERVRRMDAAIDAPPRRDAPGAAAFAAMLWARQAMAGELSAAIAVATHLDAQVDERAAELTGAAIRRRTVEKLSERHAEAERDAQQTASQLAADDLTTSRNRRGNTKR